MSQAIFICSFYILSSAWFQYSSLVPGLADWHYSYAIGEYIWILTSAVNPIVYYTINKCTFL